MARVLAGLESFIDSHSELFSGSASSQRTVELDPRRAALMQKHLDEQNTRLERLVEDVNELQDGV